MEEYNYNISYSQQAKPKVPKEVKELQQCKKLLENSQHEATSEIGNNFFTNTKLMHCRKLILQTEARKLEASADNLYEEIKQLEVSADNFHKEAKKLEISADNLYKNAKLLYSMAENETDANQDSVYF